MSDRLEPAQWSSSGLAAFLAEHVGECAVVEFRRSDAAIDEPHRMMLVEIVGPVFSSGLCLQDLLAISLPELPGSGRK
jgi:hypothetical protein